MSAVVNGPDELRQIALAEIKPDDLAEPLSEVFAQILAGADGIAVMESAIDEYPELAVLLAHLTVQPEGDTAPLTEEGLRGCITYLKQQREAIAEKGLIARSEEGDLTAVAEYQELVKRRHADARKSSSRGPA